MSSLHLSRQLMLCVLVFRPLVGKHGYIFPNLPQDWIIYFYFIFFFTFYRCGHSATVSTKLHRSVQGCGKCTHFECMANDLLGHTLCLSLVVFQWGWHCVAIWAQRRQAPFHRSFYCSAVNLNKCPKVKSLKVANSPLDDHSFVLSV